MPSALEDFGKQTAPWVGGAPAVEASKDNEMTPWKPWAQPLDSQSTYNAHFQPWQMSRAATCKPKTERLPSTTFAGRSTAQDSYMGWDRDYRRESFKPKPSVFGGGAFDPSTTHKDAYREWNVGKTPSFKPNSSVLESAPFQGRSTAQDSYMAHAGHRPPEPFLPQERDSDKAPFDSVSTMTASYLHWPLPKTAYGKKPAGTIDLGWNNKMPTGTTVYRDCYNEIRLPPGCKAGLGVQVTPGDFHLMIPKGKTAPVQKTQMFTTVVDNQKVIEVVVIAMGEGNQKGLELGRFPLSRIQPLRHGTIQVEVSMYLSLDNTVRVVAHNVQSDHTVSLNIRDKFRMAQF